MNKLVGLLIIIITGGYSSVHLHQRDPVGIWESWDVLWKAYKINSGSEAFYQEKLRINDRAMHSSPSPWLIMQRCELLALRGEFCYREQERLKTIWRITINIEEEK